MYKFRLVTILVFTSLYLLGQAEFGMSLIYTGISNTKTFEANLGRFVNNEGYPKHENCVLDSIASQYGSSKYFYREGKLHVVNNYNNNSLYITRLKYTDETLKYNGTTYTFDSLDRVVYHSYYFNNAFGSSTSSGGCRYDYTENNNLDKIKCNSDYQGGFTLESTTTVKYIYENEKIKTEDYQDVTFASGSGTSTTEYKTNYEYVGDTIIIKKDSAVRYRIFSESVGSSGNYKTTIEENEDEIWEHYRTIIYKANGLPLSVTNKHGGVETYYYVTEGEEYDDPDGDGYIGNLDCDESDPEINVGQAEIRYNGKDDDCDPSTLDDDIDQDGFILENDCNDYNSNVYPGAIEIPNNGLDDNCDGIFLHYESIITSQEKLCIDEDIDIELTSHFNYIEYEWSFGEDASVSQSTTRRTNCSYDKAGNKYISVRVKDSLGIVKHFNDSIFIKEQPKGEWDYGILPDTTVQFTSMPQIGETFNWSFGDGNTSNDANPTHQFSFLSTFFVILTVENECGEVVTGKFIDVSITSSTQNINMNKVELFPNPNNGTFSVECPIDFSNYNVRITNTHGIEQWSTKAKANLLNINLPHLAEGIYYISISDGKNHTSKKFVITN